MITNEQIVKTLVKIEGLLNNKLGDDACKEYIKWEKKIKNEESMLDNSIKAKFYGSFAYFLFDLSEYEASINMFIRAQNYGYSKDEINEFILEAFIIPNIDEFKSIYEKNIQLLVSNNRICKNIAFEDLSYYLIPVNNNNEYFIYNIREKIIEEKISFNNDLTEVKKIELPTSSEFSDFLILDEWNFNRIKKYIYCIKLKNKEVYIILSNAEKYFSCLQGALINIEVLSNAVIFSGFKELKEYFQKSNVYIPRNIIDMVGLKIKAEKVIDEIHNFRTDKEWTKRDNILLSICIPSYNRGERAYKNVIHNLGSYYDNEIEIVVSNNGTQNETKEYYDKIRNIKDCRLNYFEFKENMGFALNMCKVCELARGRFILLLSDEDFINFNVLHKILEIISSQENLAILRTPISSQGGVPSVKLCKPGEDALMTYMLTSNYISGLIFNNDILKKHQGIEYIKKNLKNHICDIYPHMFWELLLCQYGYVCGTNIVLVHEGKVEKTEFTEEKIGTGNEFKIPYYATIENRLEQHKGFLKIFKDLDICKNSFNTFRKMHIRLVNKTMILVYISINSYYTRTNVDFLKMFYDTYNFCVKSLSEVYSSTHNNYAKYYSNDLDSIKHIYNLICQSLNEK